MNSLLWYLLVREGGREGGSVWVWSVLLWSDRAGWDGRNSPLQISWSSLSLSAGGFTLGQPTNQLLLGPADQWEDSAVAGQPMRGQCWWWPVVSSRSEVRSQSPAGGTVAHTRRSDLCLSCDQQAPTQAWDRGCRPSSCLGWVPCLWWGQTKSLYWENILTNCRSTGQPSRN